ncbi:MAG: 2-C-methyl-D-erythritol 4-phosphate cytidylyltransferase, partial [Pseudomonadota bacterium]|nr:2-C-methyl-D-erythritol 4-phosphate cytidylyltransferase [Pseudomonadota bacterium]
MKNAKAPPNAALIVAGGRGSRAGSGLPKQYRTLPGHDVPGQPSQTVLGACLRAFIAHPQISGVQVVIHEDDKELYLNAINSLETHDKLYEPVYGGAERQGSVLAGLEALQAYKPKQVLVHDAARPFVSAELIDRCLTALGSAHGAIPAIAVTDTL